MNVTFEFACRDDCLDGMVPSDLRMLVAERDKLRAFAQDIMCAWPEGGLDGGELQDSALRHGLLEPSKPTQEERDEWCLDDDDSWYRNTSVLSPNA